MPVKFTDADGRAWAFRRITLADLDELQTLGLDVEAVSEDLGKLADLVVRRRAFAAVLWWFVGDAVAAADLTPADLHKALDGDALARAVEGVRDAVIDFFPYPPAAKARLIAELTADQAPAPAGSASAPPNSPASPASTPGP